MMQNSNKNAMVVNKYARMIVMMMDGIFGVLYVNARSKSVFGIF